MQASVIATAPEEDYKCNVKFKKINSAALDLV